MNNDFRTRRTIKRIQQSLVDLLHQKKLDKITVTDIVKLAKISRRSFYVHYQDKYDLVAEIEQEIIKKFKNRLSLENKKLMPVQNFSDPQLLSNTRKTFQNILQAMEDYQEKLAVLLSDNGDYQFKTKFQQLIEEEITKRLKMYNTQLRKDIPNEYAMTLLVSSLMDLIVIWLQKKKPESITEFANILTKSRMIAPLQLLSFSKQ